jgi:exocyst complex component 5
MQSAREAYIDRLDSSDLPASQKAMLLRIAGLKDSDGSKGKTEIEVTEEDGQVSVAHAKRMIKWLAEGVGRSLELNSGNETPKDIQALLGVLLTQMGEIYLDSALSAATDLASAQETTKTEPDLSYLPPIRSIIQILHLLQTTIITMLLPLTTSNITIRREIDKNTTLTLSSLESKISGILQRTLDISLAWVSRLLTNQKKTDFRPRDEDLQLVIKELQTPTCLTIFTFMSKIATVAQATLDGNNLSTFLAELATGLRTLLLEHFRKFPVSLTGGLIVSKDVTKYSELIRSWPLQGTAFERQGGMEVLVEVANLFVIGPEALRERLKGGARSRDEVSELRRYVEKREDANSVSIQAVLSTL